MFLKPTVSSLPSLTSSSSAFGMYPGARDMGDDRYEIGGEFYNTFKGHILDEAKLYDKDRTREYTIPGKEGKSQQDIFEMAHPNYNAMVGTYNKETKEFDPGLLMAEGFNRTEADKE